MPTKATKVPTFEDVDKHIQKANLKALQSAAAKARGAASPAAALPNICTSYKVVRPILALVVSLPIIPKKWKDAIKAFMKVLDAVCP